MSRVIVLSGDFIHALVERFHTIAPDDLPEEYHGLAAEDLVNILRYCAGRPRAQYPRTCTLSYTAEGVPQFACTFADGPTAYDPL